MSLKLTEQCFGEIMKSAGAAFVFCHSVAGVTRDSLAAWKHKAGLN